MYMTMKRYIVVKGRENDFEKFYNKGFTSKYRLRKAKGFIEFRLLKGINALIPTSEYPNFDHLYSSEDNFIVYACQYFWDSEDDYANWDDLYRIRVDNGMVLHNFKIYTAEDYQIIQVGS